MLVEKSPPNLIRMRFLQALFPDAAFVVVVRHPVAVAYATAKWRQSGIAADAPAPLGGRARALPGRPGQVERVLELRFEDFVRDPRAALAGVYGFLGLEPVPTGLEVRANANEAYLRRWADEGRSIRGRTAHARIRRELGERVEALGYDLDSA